MASQHALCVKPKQWTCGSTTSSSRVRRQHFYGPCCCDGKTIILYRCYLYPRAAIDINHVRYQYDSMREANSDLQNAGGQSLPDAALITLLDAAVARCTAYDLIRMFVSRARHETFIAHFNDYLQTVRSEMQMAKLASEAPQHAAAYLALPTHTPDVRTVANCHLCSMPTRRGMAKVPKAERGAMMAKERAKAESERAAKDLLGRLVLLSCVSAAPGWATLGMIADSPASGVLSAVVITRNPCTTNPTWPSASVVLS